MSERASSALRCAVAVLFWLAAWQLASIAVGNAILLAGPAEALARLLLLLTDSATPGVVWFSLSRIACGFAAGFALAIGLACLAHESDLARALVGPAVSVLRSVPIVCVIVLLLMRVGSRGVSGIAVFLAVFPAIYHAYLEALDSVDAKVGEMLRSFDVPRRTRFLAHTWPEVLPALVGVSRNVCGMAWKAAVAAELIGSPVGSIGERIYQAKVTLETADLLAWTAVIVACSWACGAAFVFLLERSGRWTTLLAPHLASARPAPKGPARLVLSDVSLGHGRSVVRAHLSLGLADGRALACCDESGAGKTTLLHTLAGLLPPVAGEVLPAQAPCVVFQEARLIEDMGAVDNVALVMGGARLRPRARALLRDLLDEKCLDVPVRRLSGGERRRVELARAVAAEGDALLLDEPFSALDEASHLRAVSFLLEHRRGRTLVVATHDRLDVERLGAREFSLGGPSSEHVA